MEYKGTVTGVFSKDWGSVKLWSLKLEGEDHFFRCARVKPDVNKGDTIWFNADENLNVDLKSLKVTTTAPAGSPKQEAGSAAGGASSKTSQSEINSRIKYQMARSDATRIVCAALQNDHLPHSANTAKGKRLDLLVGYVEAVTKQLIDQEETNS